MAKYIIQKLEIDPERLLTGNHSEVESFRCSQ